MPPQVLRDYQNSEKACGKCKRMLPASAFSLESRRASKLSGRCRDCQREDAATKRARTLESNRARSRKYHHSARGQETARKKYENGGKRRLLDKQLLALYGINFHDWALMYEWQRGVCPICINKLTFDRNTHVDHCHDTGKVRGLLCHHCNLLLGHIRGDRAVTVQRAIQYLEAHSAAPCPS